MLFMKSQNNSMNKQEDTRFLSNMYSNTLHNYKIAQRHLPSKIIFASLLSYFVNVLSSKNKPTPCRIS